MKQQSDVLVLEVYRPRTQMKGNVIRIDSRAAAALSELQCATGLSVSVIASKLICFAAQRVEITERSE